MTAKNWAEDFLLVF